MIELSRIKILADKYAEMLRALGYEPVQLPITKFPESHRQALNHALWLAEVRIPGLLAGETEKAQARLKIIETTFWFTKIYTPADLDKIKARLLTT